MRVRGRSFFLVRDPSSVPLSRRRLRDLITQWGPHLDEDSEIALMTVTSELVANGVLHGAGNMLTVGVGVGLEHRRVLVEVYDDSLALRTAEPQASTPGAGEGFYSSPGSPSATAPSGPAWASGSGPSRAPATAPDPVPAVLPSVARASSTDGPSAGEGRLTRRPGP
ncbi:ATP-binding protein [Streptomyces uncialis]|uniref:ATP-binding protein n=1 Tax=Streptomyces uncialis TaxID=1048205 RepID=UPI00380C76F2